MKNIRIILLALALALTASPAFASSLGVAGDYNAFVFGSFNAMSSDTEGSLAAGGSVSLSSYAVHSSQSPRVTGPTLVVGGALSFYNGQIDNGTDAYVAGAMAGNAGFINNSGTIHTNVGAAGLPVNFTAAQSYYADLSTTLQSASSSAKTTVLSTNSVTSNDWLSDALSALSSGSTVVVNVSGTDITWSNWGETSLSSYSDKLLFNFYEAQNLELYSIGLYGSVLAPDADVTGYWGQMHGTLIADSFQGIQYSSLEFHEATFTGDLPTPTPIPGSIALLGTGLMGLVAWRRRR